MTNVCALDYHLYSTCHLFRWAKCDSCLATSLMDDAAKGALMGASACVVMVSLNRCCLIAKASHLMCLYWILFSVVHTSFENC